MQISEASGKVTPSNEGRKEEKREFFTSRLGETEVCVTLDYLMAQTLL